MRKVVVTIDGPAGAGKSSVAKLLARRLGYRLLDTGAIYRAVALTAKQQNIAWTDGPACGEIARMLDIRFDFVGDKNHVYLGGDDVDRGDPHARHLAGGVSSLGASGGARRAARAPAPPRRRWWRGGRGPGHRDDRVPSRSCEVLPHWRPAPERARRRVAELAEGGTVVDPEVTLREIEERDTRDASRDVAPMVPAHDAILVDSSTQTLEEVVDSLALVVETRTRT